MSIDAENEIALSHKQANGYVCANCGSVLIVNRGATKVCMGCRMLWKPVTPEEFEALHAVDSK